MKTSQLDESIIEALDYDCSTPEQGLKKLASIRRKFAEQIRTNENARELFLDDLGYTYIELKQWNKAYKITSERVKMVRPATRGNNAFAFLVADHLLAARHAVRPKPYLCELLDEIRFIEDIAVEPAAVMALREMIKLPDYKLCGKALYIFKKVARRFEMPELKFTPASVEQLTKAYAKRYLKQII